MPFLRLLWNRPRPPECVRCADLALASLAVLVQRGKTLRYSTPRGGLPQGGHRWRERGPGSACRQRGPVSAGCIRSTPDCWKWGCSISHESTLIDRYSCQRRQQTPPPSVHWTGFDADLRVQVCSTRSMMDWWLRSETFADRTAEGRCERRGCRRINGKMDRTLRIRRRFRLGHRWSRGPEPNRTACIRLECDGLTIEVLNADYDRSCTKRPRVCRTLRQRIAAAFLEPKRLRSALQMSELLSWRFGAAKWYRQTQVKGGDARISLGFRKYRENPSLHQFSLKAPCLTETPKRTAFAGA
jgi:hypothetical protein